MPLVAKVSPKMPRAKSKAVSEGNGLVIQDESGYDELTIAELYRVLKERFDGMDSHVEKLTGKIRKLISV